jgi:superfamily II DNA/RNA helicase
MSEKNQYLNNDNSNTLSHTTNNQSSYDNGSKYFSAVKRTKTQNNKHSKNYNNNNNYNNKNKYETSDRSNEEVENSYVEYIELTEEEREDVVLPIDSFDDLRESCVSENIIRGIFGYGFDKPSPIQARSIRPVLTGMDVISQAQSGMGKTGAFCIGVLGRIEENKDYVQAIILAHTRELALQIDSVFRQIASYTNIRTSLCIKGIPRQENIDRIQGKSNSSKGRPHIIIGTPGRINDMLNTRDFVTGNYVMDLSQVKCIVVDEADEMLGTTNKSYNRKQNTDTSEEPVGFLEQVKKIFRCMPSSVQICLFSATMSHDFFKLTEQFMRNPIKILIKTEELTLDGIQQYYINVEQNKYKFDTLCALYSLLTINQSIIYCNSLKQVEILTNKLRDNEFVVSNIHGRMTPQERELAMYEFRNGKSRVLISTDLLSRGIDVQQVSVVINYDVPNNIENYLHRIGRSGRYGRKGVAINFITNFDESKIKTIQEYYSTMINPLPADIENLLD